MIQEDLRTKTSKPAKPKLKVKAAEPEQPKKRYIAFANPARVGIADSETGEVVGEGETAILEILADIKCDLEIIKDRLLKINDGKESIEVIKF